MSAIIPLVGTNPAFTTSPRPVIFDTDWMADVDDAVAMRLLCHAERLGLVDVRAAVMNVRSTKGPGSLDALFIYDGHPNLPIGMVPAGTGAVATPSSYVATFFDSYPHREGWAASTAPAAEIYRRALAAEANGSVDIISVGMLTALSQLLQSSADAISPLTGLQLVTAKVRHLWVMGGNWPSGSEWNLTQDGPSAQYVISNWPTSVPITFLGYEAAIGVPVGANLRHLVDVDPVAAALSSYGAGTTGRTAWDPMLTWLACLGSPTAAGYTTVQGTATVNSSGGNSWTSSPSGPHRYVIKTQQDRWYINDLNSRLLPGINPPPAPLPGASRTALPVPVIYSPKPASFTRPVRNAADNLLVQYHADDLVDLSVGATVAHMDDRRLTMPARQLSSGARPTVAQIGNRRCLQFAVGQWMTSDYLDMPSTFTVYALVRWAVSPSSTQTVVAGNAISAPRQRIFRLSALSGGGIQGSGSSVDGVTSQVDVAGTASTGAWHVIAVRVTPTQVETYLDSASNGATSYSGQQAGRTSLALGSRYTDQLSEQFVGYLREVRVYAAGHDSATVATVSAEIFPTTPDTTAPSVPTGLTATPGNTIVSLFWSASTDAGSGVVGYKVRRGGTVIASPTDTTYGDTGLSNGTTYSYTVSAIDDDGNESAQSSTVTVVPASVGPGGVAGLRSWYKADAISGLSDGAAVSSWSDSSGSGRTATNGVSTDRPIYKTGIVNGLPVVRFDGAGDCLVIPSTNPLMPSTDFTVIAVARIIGGTGNRTVIGPDNIQGNPQVTVNSAGKLEIVKSNTSLIGTGTAVLSTGTAYVMAWTCTPGTGGSWATYLNGAADGTGSTSTAMVGTTGCQYLIGRRGNAEPWNGDLAEILIYDGVLSGTDRAAVTAALGTKYGITVV